MSEQMHFRKRLLMQYEHEKGPSLPLEGPSLPLEGPSLSLTGPTVPLEGTSLPLEGPSLPLEPSVEFQYPPSPSSLDSGMVSSHEDDNSHDGPNAKLIGNAEEFDFSQAIIDLSLPKPIIKEPTEDRSEGNTSSIFSCGKLNEIINRIARVFAVEQFTKQRLNDFAKQGIKVVEANNIIDVPRRLPKFQKYPVSSTYDHNLLLIGPNGTQMPKAAWLQVDWSKPIAVITRKFLMSVFDRYTLATHTLSGRPSPAFKDFKKPEKYPLDVGKVQDIVYIVTSRTNATVKDVRMSITTKCADECKMMRWRKQKCLNAAYIANRRFVQPY